MNEGCVTLTFHQHDFMTQRAAALTKHKGEAEFTELLRWSLSLFHKNVVLMSTNSKEQITVLHYERIKWQWEPIWSLTKLQQESSEYDIGI